MGSKMTSMSRILVFGAESLVGSHFVKTSEHRVVAAGRRDPRSVGLPVEEFCKVDLERPGDAASIVSDSNVDSVVNFAAATDVDAVERERPASADAPRGTAFEVNSLAPAAIAGAAFAKGRSFVSLSTDFVFDGREGPYPESARPSDFSSRVSWYGWTKGRGEELVRNANPSASIIRISYPYRAEFALKDDFGRRILAAWKQSKRIAYFRDQWITPTWVPDVSRAVDLLLQRRLSGTFHVASPERTTPYDFARELLASTEGDEAEILSGSMEAFLRKPGSTPRPQRGGLSCARIEAEGLRLTSWREGIRRLVHEHGVS